MFYIRGIVKWRGHPIGGFGQACHPLFQFRHTGMSFGSEIAVAALANFATCAVSS